MAEMDPYFFGDDGDDGGLLLDGGENLSGDGTPQIFHLTESSLSDSMFERKVAARKVSEAFRNAYFQEQDVGCILEVVVRLSEDEEQTVRTELMEQIPQVAIFCHEVGPQLDYVVPQHILPCFVKLMTDKFTQVRKPTQTGLLLLLERGIIAPSQVHDHIYPVIMQCTAPHSNDEQRTEISAFMSKIAALIWKDVTIAYYLERFCDLCEDSLFQVRRVCASSMGCWAGVIGGPLTEQVLLPRFLTLCKDDIWGVRKGCAEVFTEVSLACQLPIRKKSLSPSFVFLLEDSSRWVRISAYQTLGSLIATFICDESPTPLRVLSTIEQEFLEKMTSIVRKPMKWKKVELSPSKEVAEARNEENCEHVPGLQSLTMKFLALKQSRVHEANSPPGGFAGAGDTQQGSSESNHSGRIEEGGTINSRVQLNQISQHENLLKATKLDLKKIESDAKDISEGKLLDKSEGFWEGEDEDDSNEVLMIDPTDDLTASFEERRLITYQEMLNVKEYVEKQQSSKQNEPMNMKVIDSMSTIMDKAVTDSNSSELVCERTNSASKNDDNSYNTFQYWRLPFSNIELDTAVTNIHARHSQGNVTNFTEFSLNRISEITLTKNEGYSAGSDENVDNQRSLEDSESEKQNRARKNANDLVHNCPVTSSTSPNVELTNEAEIQLQTSSQPSVPQIEVEKCVSETVEVISETHILESNLPPTVVGGNVTDVYRSYLNLFNPSSDQRNKKPPNPYDDDYYNDITSLIDPDDLPYILRAHGPKGEMGRLLQDLPKSNTINQQDIVPPALLEHFVGMCEPMRDHTLDSELANFCVYSLPAVVLTLGPQNWSLMRDCFESLACKFQWKIRFTLAASLHDIARVLGPELTERDLVPFYDAMTKDLDEVRIGILRNLAKFIKILGKTERRRCLNSLGSFLSTDNKRNWRFRLELTHQVKELVEIYEAEEVFKHLCPVSVDLITDSIAEVRRTALDLVSLLVSRLSDCYLFGDGSEPNLVREFILELVETLGHSAKWVQRQTFATLSGRLIKKGCITPKQFAQDILPHLVSLSSDKVPNVRLVVAQTLLHVANLDYFVDPSNPHNEILMSAIEKLQSDTDRDVRFYSTIQDTD